MKLLDFLYTKAGRAWRERYDGPRTMVAIVNHWSRLLGQPVTAELATVKNFVEFRNWARENYCHATAKNYINRLRRLLKTVCPETEYPFLPAPVRRKGDRTKPRATKQDRRRLPHNAYNVQPPPLPTADVGKLAAPSSPLIAVWWHVVYPQRMVLKVQKTQQMDTGAIKSLGEYLQREPLLSDLTDETVQGWMAWLRRKGLAPQTVNAYRHRILATWRFLARKRFGVEQFPEVGQLAEPAPVPTAWTQEQLHLIFAACRAWTGPDFDGVKGSGWWLALHYVVYDTGMRAAELFALRWDWLDWQGGDLVVPAAVRKGHRQGKVYSLHGTTLENLRTIQQPSRDLIFPIGCDVTRFYARYSHLLKSVGLPTDRRSKLHRMRRTCASWLESVQPGAATEALGHSSRRVTEKYLDVRITKRTRPSDLLPRPEAGKDGVV